MRQYDDGSVSNGCWYVAIPSLPSDTGEDWVAGDYPASQQAHAALKVANQLHEQGYDVESIREILSEYDFGPTAQNTVVWPRLESHIQDLQGGE